VDLCQACWCCNPEAFILIHEAKALLLLLVLLLSSCRTV